MAVPFAGTLALNETRSHLIGLVVSLRSPPQRVSTVYWRATDWLDGSTIRTHSGLKSWLLCATGTPKLTGSLTRATLAPFRTFRSRIGVTWAEARTHEIARANKSATARPCIDAA